MRLLAVKGPTKGPMMVSVQQQVCGAGSMLMTRSQRLLVETWVCAICFQQQCEHRLHYRHVLRSCRK